jgi:hypothetical protein
LHWSYSDWQESFHCDAGLAIAGRSKLEMFEVGMEFGKAPGTVGSASELYYPRLCFGEGRGFRGESRQYIFPRATAKS